MHVELAAAPPPHYIVLGSAVVVMMAVVGLSMLVGPIARQITPLDGSPADQAAFPELVALMQPTADELQEQVVEDLATKETWELVATLKLIGRGQSDLSADHQRIYIETAVRGSAVEVAVAAVQAVERFDDNVADGVMNAALHHDDPLVREAGLAEATRRRTPSSMRLVLTGLGSLEPGDATRAPFLDAIRQFDSAQLEPELIPHLRDPDLVRYLEEHGAMRSLSALASIRAEESSGALFSPVPAQTIAAWESAIGAIWQRQLATIVDRGFRCDQDWLLVGDEQAVEMSGFLQLPVASEVRDEMVAALRAWPATWQTPDLRIDLTQWDYYGFLQKWTGQTVDELVTADVTSEEELWRRVALAQIAVRRSSAGVQALFDLVRDGRAGPDVRFQIGNLQGEQLVVVVDQLTSPHPEVRELAFELLKEKKPGRCISPLYELAVSDTEAAVASRVALSHDAEDAFLLEPMSARDNARLAIITSISVYDVPFPRTTVIDELDAPLQDRLVWAMLARQLVPTDPSRRPVTEERAWQWLLAVDPVQMLPILNAEFAAAHPQRRSAILTAMARSGHPLVMQELAGGLLDDDRRETCAIALRFAGSLAEPAVLERLDQDPLPEPVVLAALEVLQKIATKQSLPVIERWTDGSAAVRPLVKTLLERLQQDEVRPYVTEATGLACYVELERLREQSSADPVDSSAPSITALLTMLGSVDSAERASAASRLMRADVTDEDRDRVVEALVSVLTEADVALSWFALQAIGRWSVGTEVPRLSEQLQQQNPYLTAAAASGLARIGTAESIEALVALLRSDAGEIAARCLADAGSRQPDLVEASVGPLLEEADINVRIRAATILSMLGRASAWEQIEQAVEADPWLEPMQPQWKRNYDSHR